MIDRDFRCKCGHVTRVRFSTLSSVKSSVKCEKCGEYAAIVFESPYVHFHSTDFTKRVL